MGTRNPKRVKRTEAFRAAQVSHWYTGKHGWPGGSSERLKLIADLEARLPRDRGR